MVQVKTIGKALGVILIISFTLVMIASAGSFEFKVTSEQHSKPLNNGFSLPNSTATTLPTTTPSHTVTPTPVATPLETPTIVPQATKNLSTYTMLLSSGSSDEQDEFLSKVISLLEGIPGQKPSGQTGTEIQENPGGQNGIPGGEPTQRVPDQYVNDTNAHGMVNNTPSGGANPDKIINNTTPQVSNSPGGTRSGFTFEVRGNGTVAHVFSNGEFYGIVSDAGTHYYPSKIDPLFRVEGLRVQYDAMEHPETPDPHGWGRTVDLISLVQVGGLIDPRIEGNGTVHSIGLEGGFYGIRADTGSEYLPINLNGTFKTDGLRVNFSAYPAGMPTTSMWGTPVRLISMTPTGEPVVTQITMTGNVTWVNLGTGFYGIVGNDGTLYIPEDIDRNFTRNGLHVNFSAERADNDLGIYQVWGVPVRLTSLEEYRK